MQDHVSTEITDAVVVQEENTDKPNESDNVVVRTANIAETIVWNQTNNNISVGLAIINKDQLHVAVYRTTDIPKHIDPEKARGLTMIKPGEAMLFKTGV